MPSSLIIVALVLAWLVVLVPMIARKRQEVTKTADSALAARVVHRVSANATVREELDMLDEPEAAPFSAAHEAAPISNRAEDLESPSRPYRPGRGGYDAEAAAEAARVRYVFRQRVVIGMLLLAVATGLVAGLALHILWPVHALIDVGLVGYLIYLRRQVRIENEIRQRRAARTRRIAEDGDPEEFQASEVESVADDRETVPPPRAPLSSRPVVPGAAVLDMDESDADFAHLDSIQPQHPYGRAVGE